MRTRLKCGSFCSPTRRGLDRRALGSGGGRDASGHASRVFSFALSDTPLKLIIATVGESVSSPPPWPCSAARSPALKGSPPGPSRGASGERPGGSRGGGPGCWGGGWRPPSARADKNGTEPGPGDKLKTGTQAPGYNNPVECERPDWTRKPGAGARRWARAFSPASRSFPHFSPGRRSRSELYAVGAPPSPRRREEPGAREGGWCQSASDRRSRLLPALGLPSPVAPTGEGGGTRREAWKGGDERPRLAPRKPIDTTLRRRSGPCLIRTVDFAYSLFKIY